MISILQILSIILLIATAISSLRTARWWVKFWDVSRVHVATFIIIVLVTGLIIFDLNSLWNLALLVALTGALAYHVSVILPFTFFHSVELQSTNEKDHSISLLAANVRSKNKDYNRLCNLVKSVDPDLVLLTEVDHAWCQGIKSLKSIYPYQIIQEQENTYGIAMFSKYELEDSHINFLVDDDVPSIHTTICFDEIKVQFLGLHPRPPTPWTKAEDKDIELIKAAALTNTNVHPTIMGGDLNDVGWSKITQTFKELSGLLDPRVGRGFFNTYNALIPVFRVPIDHLFVSKHFRLNQIKRLPKIGSDHFPVFLEVNLEA